MSHSVLPPATTTPLAADLAHVLHPLHHPASTHAARIWVRGRGAIITDSTGRDFIDGLAGLWNVNVGHGRAELAEAARDQMATLAFASAYAGSTNHPAMALAETLSRLAYPSINAFFLTSGGAESTETSIKIARFYWKAVGRPDKTKIISRHRAYHGLTMAAMSATGLPAFWPMFEPRVPGFSHIAAPDPYRYVPQTPGASVGRAAADELEAAILREGPDTVAAFIAEPIQGAGGVIIPPDDYFPRIREICTRHGVLFIADDVITGFGRTGTWFGLEHWGVEPDIMQFAKGITSGYVPLGGVGVSDAVKAVIDGVPPARRFMHAFTYSGHPTGCAVAIRNLAILADEGLVARAAALGRRLASRLAGLTALDGVGHVRSRGLIGAVEVVADRTTRALFPADARMSERLTDALLSRGLYTRVVLDCICIAPPLVIDETDLDRLVDIVGEAVGDAVRQARTAT
jgi:adenosylmethionine-8-amino-7-oxononanoate aminotransferase